jgi:hypothetical protein
MTKSGTEEMALKFNYFYKCCFIKASLKNLVKLDGRKLKKNV